MSQSDCGLAANMLLDTRALSPVVKLVCSLQAMQALQYKRFGRVHSLTRNIRDFPRSMN